MSDTKILLQGLNNYHKSLNEHIDQLRKNFQTLESRWRDFNSVSEGHYAEQFKTGWLKTEAQFKQYIKRTEKIAKILDERINDLKLLNQAE